MRIEYLRQMQGSYMRIELEAGLGRTEEEMLSHNRIQGILPVSWQREDGKTLLRYDITGKIALDALLEDKKADAELLVQLFSGICNTIKQLEKFLLFPEGILLSPETVFCDYKTGEIFFCYFPEGEMPFAKRLQRLMEYLLTKTDHKNNEAVELAYGLYEEMAKPSYRLCDIQNYLQEQRNRQREGTDREDVEESVQSEVCRTVLQEEKKKDWFESIIRSVKETLPAWINEREWKRIKKKHSCRKNGLLEVEEQEERGDFPTELLSENHKEKMQILKYEGRDALPDFQITRLPFLIGSAEDCDGVLKAPGISRHHARILLKDDIYFIEDLNSTNGTRVEGGLLTYKTKVSLKENASVCFADQLYRFQ